VRIPSLRAAAQLVGILSHPWPRPEQWPFARLPGRLPCGRAALSASPSASLHQELVSQNQHNEKQHRGQRANKKCPELLKDFLHSGPSFVLLFRLFCFFSLFLFFSVLGRLCGLFRAGWNTFLYQERSVKLIETGPIWDFRDGCHFWNDSPK